MEDAQEALSQACSNNSTERCIRPKLFRGSEDLKKYLSLFSPVNASFIKFMNIKHLVSTTLYSKNLHTTLYVKNHPHLFEHAKCLFYLIVPTSQSEKGLASRAEQ